MHQPYQSRHDEDLKHIVRASPWFMSALGAVRSLHLRSWCIGAGAVRNLVWDHLHRYNNPSALSDIDVAYFDAGDPRPEAEAEIQAVLEARAPGVPWEVTNQALVHLWFEGYFGHTVGPLGSLEEAVASWPEYATSVGVYLGSTGSIEVIAPHGLDDLFALRIRRNPARVSLETYRPRVEQKQYQKRWPRVSVDPC
jgi:uncharacterized protein